ncbi:unnamed protein product [marine sediment metagenome]|uniref:Uncharacterized protein n=1 Tax=marine sediment metagenome TaxID=412755 RepID=X0YEX7_9ZZZZ
MRLGYSQFVAQQQLLRLFPESEPIEVQAHSQTGAARLLAGLWLLPTINKTDLAQVCPGAKSTAGSFKNYHFDIIQAMSCAICPSQ